jgi:serine/threonine protein kinase
MGIVYLARQVSLNRLVALKVLGTALTDHSEIARFQREAQAVARLDHPGIARIHFIGQDRQVCYIAMEYIDGASLRDVLKRLLTARDPSHSIDAVVAGATTGQDEATEVRFDQETEARTPGANSGALPEDSASLTPEPERLMTSPGHIRRCCVIVRDAALALAHAHERGVIHRDLKPENLLLDRQERVHLIDFGLARFFEDVTLTNTGALVGTPLYMSPEQVSGRIVVDSRTDVYSLGMVLYELLTLRRPITAPTREGVLREVATKALPPVSRLNHSVPRDLESVVHKATAKDPDDRYQSALAFAEDLERVLDPPLTPRPALAERLAFALDLRNVLSKKPVAAEYYRYRFDEKEIAAERPRDVIFLSFAFMLLAMLGFWISLVTAITGARALPVTNSDLLNRLISIALIIITSSCFISSCFILTGRKWARALAAVLCVIIGLPMLAASAVSIYSTIKYFNLDSPGIIMILWILVPDLLSLSISLVPVVLVPLLYRRGITTWFDFAERLRSEHKQHASPLRSDRTRRAGDSSA